MEHCHSGSARFERGNANKEAERESLLYNHNHCIDSNHLLVILLLCQCEKSGVIGAF